MEKIELLAPAGNREALERACAAGADAVYLGFSVFSARASAGFGEEELRSAITFAHLHRMRVHVTVNTLVKDSELDSVWKVLSLLQELHADAILVQDLGVLRMARTCFPDLTVHASTQMAIHNRTGVAFLSGYGVRRVVLARECSLDEIEKCTAFAKSHQMEIEVFCHGAQCVSVSGECLFSSYIGERSGNRGRCAQPCRLMYRFRGKNGAWLSPRDVCTRDSLDRLGEAGVSSLKIEGRLKRPEYVAVVARSYNRGLKTGEKATAEEMTGLRQIFQRGGFMPGYAFGSEDAGVIDMRHVSHRGVEIGRVLSISPDRQWARIGLDAELHDGDQLAFSDSRDAEMLYSGPGAACTDTVRIRLRKDLRIQKGDRVRRITDARQLEEARAIPLPKIPVWGTLRAMPGESLMLTLTDGEVTVTGQAGVVERAQKHALQKADAVSSVGKMGDTPFCLRQLDVNTEDAFVSASGLNALRRETLEKLEKAREEHFALPAHEPGAQDTLRLPEGEVPSLLIFREPEQTAYAPSGCTLAWYPEDFRADALEDGIRVMGQQHMTDVWFCLPEVCEDGTLQELHAFVSRHSDFFGGVVIGSVGQLGLTWPVPTGCGSGVPVFNRRAAQFLFEAGCSFVTASSELTGEELRTLTEGCGRILTPAYGRSQLMLLHHCPARTFLGLREGHGTCRMCDEHAQDALEGTCLEDRMGESYPLLRQRLPEGCLIRLMAPRPMNNLKRTAQRAPVCMEMTDETDFRDCLDAVDNPERWLRGVE